MTTKQPDFSGSTAREISQMLTHPVINPFQQGLTSESVNRREPVFLFVVSRSLETMAFHKKPSQNLTVFSPETVNIKKWPI